MYTFINKNTIYLDVDVSQEHYAGSVLLIPKQYQEVLILIRYEVNIDPFNKFMVIKATRCLQLFDFCQISDAYFLSPMKCHESFTHCLVFLLLSYNIGNCASMRCWCCDKDKQEFASKNSQPAPLSGYGSDLLLEKCNKS